MLLWSGPMLARQRLVVLTTAGIAAAVPWALAVRGM
jgi:hypothetical protein